MTAVASAPVMSNRDSGTETGTEHSPSRFTAVNGRDSTATGPNAGNPAQSTPMNGGERGAQPAGQETQDVSRVNPGDRDDQSEISSPSTYTHKRKRSESGEQESRYSDGYRRGSLNHPGDAPPSNGVGSGSVSEIEPSNSVAASGRSDTNEASQPANRPWPEYESQLINQAQRAQQMDASDAQLADALQREAHSQEPRTLSRSTPSASGVQPASSPVYQADRSAAAVQVAPKRKRVFSNRTKTGCMTCRRRKKKCDEQHPACESLPPWWLVRDGFPWGLIIALQVTTASAAASYARAITREVLGRSPRAPRRLFLYSQKKAIRIPVANIYQKQPSSMTGNLACPSTSSRAR